MVQSKTPKANTGRYRTSTTLVSHGIFVAAQGVEKFSLSGIVDQDPVLDRNHQLGTVRAEAQVIDGIALWLVVPLWHLIMKGKQMKQSSYIVSCYTRGSVPRILFTDIRSVLRMYP